MPRGKFLTSLALLWCLWDPTTQQLGPCYPFEIPGAYTLTGDVEDPRLDPELDNLLNDYNLSDREDQ